MRDKLPYVSLGEFPTPVQRLDALDRNLGMSRFYIKRDDLSGRAYGGNKPRKLEFLLAQALRANAKEVVTFGCAGSNHALSTAIYAQQVGLKSISMLMPQPNAHYVRRNLLMSHYCGAEMHLCGAEMEFRRSVPLVFLATTYQLIRHRLRIGLFPQIIPPGGSSPLGTVGFVNAAFELKDQIMRGEMPEPDCIYIACGTMGTVAGLMLGLRAVNLKSRIVSVRVTNEKFVNTEGMLTLIRKTNVLLCSSDPSFPEFQFSGRDIDIRHDFFGQKYALFTEKGMEAIDNMQKNAGIKLDGTYTGKTFAAIIGDAKSGALCDKTVLFWHTLNSKDFTESIANIDYHNLPPSFHRYFEDEVQNLDRDFLYRGEFN